MSYDALFNQVGVNNDAGFHQGEFSQWGSSGFGGTAGFAAGGEAFGSAAVGGAAFGGAAFGGGVANCPNIVDTPSRPDCPPPQTYPTNSQGHFIDPNPRTETRPATGEPQTYTRNVRVSFFQPPPPPPPGPLTIIERRPPPQPAPPPVRIRQPPPPGCPPPAPVTLRETPPQPPPPIPPEQKTVMLAPCPPPPRSVITERFEPPPPRPQDVILERWLQYGPRPCRPVRRVPAPCCPPPSPAPRNLIITYKSQPARVAVNFQRLGVTQADPQAYRQQHGGNLLDTASFLQRVHSLGVVQDISLPAGNQSGSMQGGDFSSGSDQWSSGVTSDAALGEFSSSEHSYGGAEVGGGFDVGGAATEGVGSTMDFDSNYVQQGL